MKNLMFTFLAAAAAIAAWGKSPDALSAAAANGANAVVLTVPAEGATVPLLKPEMLDYLKMDRAARRKFFADQSCRDQMVKWGDKPLKVRLAWQCDGKVEKYHVTVAPKRGETVSLPVFDQGTVKNELEIDNLEIGCTYEWTVVAGLKGGAKASAKGTFVTDATAPRLVRVDGIPNLRDFGGRVGLDGRRVRQGMIYRSGGLNANANKYYSKDEIAKMLKDGNLLESVPEMSKEEAKNILADYSKGKKYTTNHLVKKWQKGRERLNPVTRKYMRETMGIKTDIDLRSDRECYGMTGSPLGEGVAWVHVPSSSYGGMGSENGKKPFAKVFKVFLDEKNYPIDFHCIAGADRTGAVGFILGALLGEDEEELWKDWEVTAFQASKLDFRHSTRFDRLVAVFNAYPGANMTEKVGAYVKSLGFTDADIAKFRSIMLQ